jgi:penicillin G amidase
MQASSPAAAIFAAWTRRLPDTLVADKLGHDLATRYEGWSDLFVSRFLINTLEDRNNPWCDVIATPKHEDCATAAHTALVAALNDIHTKLGSARSDWRWDRLHTAVFSHQPFGYVPFLRPIFNRDIANGGGNATVDLGEFDPDLSFTQSVVPGYRQVIDLANMDNGRFIIAIGQSGHALSPHYDDYLKDWRAVRYRPMRFADAQIVLREQASLLRLEPEP